MDERIWAHVEAVLGSGTQVVLATTGGGAELAGWLLNHPGASQAVLEVQVPYCAPSLAAFLERSGPHRVDTETARAMAVVAYHRARGFAGAGRAVVGVGCTAALATRHERRGQDRACLALRTRVDYRFCSLDFARGAAGRLEQEDVLSRCGLQALAEAVGAGTTPPGPWPDWVAINCRTVPVQEPLEQLLLGRVEVVEMGLDGAWSTAQNRSGRLLFSGSFNPLHEGHVELVAAAKARAGQAACLELSVDNVDKPSLAYEEVLDRLDPLRGRYPVVVDRAPIFADKARLFPRSTFVIGFDTAVRLLEPRYYAGGAAGRDRALDELAGSGSRFLVAGRLVHGRYRTLADLEVPAAHRGMLAAIPETVFRRDLSSTEIRQRQAAGYDPPSSER